MPTRSKSSRKVGVHGHACRECRRRYEDTCSDPGDVKRPGPDERCPSCRTGKPNPWWYESRRPQPCCRQSSRVVTKEEHKTYRLAGSAVWFICTECARTHPFDPARPGSPD